MFINDLSLLSLDLFELLLTGSNLCLQPIQFFPERLRIENHLRSEIHSVPVFLRIIINHIFQRFRVLKILLNDPLAEDLRLIAPVLFNKLECQLPELVDLILFLI